MLGEAQFDHEKLDLYNVAIDFVAWAGELVDGPLSGCRLNAVKHLDQASTSVPLNIAEGNGKRSLQDRCRFLDVARGSALESAACLDVLIARKALTREQTVAGKALLVRVVDMLFRMTARLLAMSASTIREEGAEYGSLAGPEMTHCDPR